MNAYAELSQEDLREHLAMEECQLRLAQLSLDEAIDLVVTEQTRIKRATKNIEQIKHLIR